MIALLLFTCGAILVALFMGAQLGRSIHYGRGFEAGSRHASRVLRDAIRKEIP